MAQNREIRDRFTAVGEHHRDIDGDPTGVMPATPLPYRTQRITEPINQPGGIGQIGQQPGTDVPDHASPTTSNNDLRTRPGSLHLESAFPAGRMRPSASPIVPDQKALSPYQATHPARPK